MSSAVTEDSAGHKGLDAVDSDPRNLAMTTPVAIAPARATRNWLTEDEVIEGIRASGDTGPVILRLGFGPEGAGLMQDFMARAEDAAGDRPVYFKWIPGGRHHRGRFRGLVLGAVKDLVSDFIRHGRRDDKDLPRGAIEASLTSGHVSVDEIVDAFREHLEGALAPPEEQTETPP